jgi:hypothetical protein
MGSLFEHNTCMAMAGIVKSYRFNTGASHELNPGMGHGIGQKWLAVNITEY